MSCCLTVSKVEFITLDRNVSVIAFQYVGPATVFHGSDGPAGRVGLGRVTILTDLGGSGQRFGFLSFLLIISRYLNRCESSYTAFGLIDFLL